MPRKINGSLFKRGKYYHLSYYDPELGRSVTKSTKQTSKEKAEAFRREFMKQFQEKQLAKKAKNLHYKATIHDAIKHFRKVNSNVSDSTIETYKYFFKKFLSTGIFKIEDPVGRITKLTAEDWLIGLKELGLKQNTLAGLSKNLKKFLRFLFEYNYLEPFKLNDNVVYKPAKPTIEIFSDDEIGLILDEVEKQKNNELKIAVYFLLFTGLRSSDIFNIRIKDIYFKNNKLNVYSPKTDERWSRELSDEFLEIIAPLFEGKSPEERIVSHSNYKIMNQIVKRFIKRIGIWGNGNVIRKFRKTYISLGYLNGVDYPTLGRMVGHKKITTTAKYYTYFDTEKQKKEVNKIKILDKINKVKEGEEVFAENVEIQSLDMQKFNLVA